MGSTDLDPYKALSPKKVSYLADIQVQVLVKAKKVWEFYQMHRMHRDPGGNWDPAWKDDTLFIPVYDVLLSIFQNVNVGIEKECYLIEQGKTSNE